eukprot:CAMPEP_0179258640 /NCGR_PEP_ID=MMETSP0797-20121207/25419_1 /TAXON_ID=47934 /ORGANISM="Dinophysis acuminata, Strain DAEP01" /LENGTH=42 /DNA_ID= /DNA_START= /DNA_END= /DNA_ORIENTATION=
MSQRVCDLPSRRGRRAAMAGGASELRARGTAGSHVKLVRVRV